MLEKTKCGSLDSDKEGDKFGQPMNAPIDTFAPYLGIHASRYTNCPWSLGEDTWIGDQLYRAYFARTWNVPSTIWVCSHTPVNMIDFLPIKISSRTLGPPELVAPLLSLSSLSAPLLSNTSANASSLSPSDTDQFLQDLARRFEPDNEMDEILGPVVRQLLFHESLFRPEGLGGGDASWRGVISGLEVLVSVKSIATMITRMEEWNPQDATAATFERVSLLGPICRLGVFSLEWVSFLSCLLFFFLSNIECLIFSQVSPIHISQNLRSGRGTTSSLLLPASGVHWRASRSVTSLPLVGSTLMNLGQSSLFQIFNTLVRASAESREAVLDYFSRVVSLNVKRTGMQVRLFWLNGWPRSLTAVKVDPTTVASDGFMLNMQAVLLRFAEPFMDANYTKV